MKTLVINLCLVSVIEILDESHVIHLLPNFSAIKDVVPEPHVGSKTKSPGSVDINIHLCITKGLVSTTNLLCKNEFIVSVQTFSNSVYGKSSKYLL